MPALRIAFLVMPFGKKATGRGRSGAPTTVDFDALWYKVYEPLLSELNYKPVRADRDVGALIISQMIQRLALADLVVADVTLPNANVYYEIGVRHAAQAKGCVLTSANWAKPVFDLAQMRQIRYPLGDGGINEATAAAAGAALRDGLLALVGGLSPVFESVPGYPSKVDRAKLSAFAGFDELSQFQAAIRSARAAPGEELCRRAAELVAEYGQPASVTPVVALDLLLLLRDAGNWREMVTFASLLPDHIRNHPPIREQQYFAMAKGGNPEAAVGLFETLIDQEGESSERRGLLGGRYKDLWQDATNPSDKRRFLDKSIEQYELGMRADLNAFYPSSNLPRLYRERGDPGDEHAAEVAAVTALAACERALARGEDDGWVKPTMLGAAFDAGDVAKARQIVPEVRQSGPAEWELESTIEDLELSVGQQVDPVVARELRAQLTILRSLLPAHQEDPGQGESPAS